jgi:D-alanyl-D-alanine carboxypeptidase
MRHGTLAVGVGEAITAQLQKNLNDYQMQNAAIERFTGIALQVSLGDGSVIAVSSGDDGLPDAQPMTPSTLFQIGSNTKSFTAALILMLEAAGKEKLSIDQTVGDWLPQYPAWKSVTIRSMLNMTSRIPDCLGTDDILKKQLDLDYQFTPKELIASVDPDQGSTAPPTTGYYYCNTGYILAGLIIEKASEMSYKHALESLILKPQNLTSTYYFDGPTPRDIVQRMSAGFLGSAAEEPSLAPLAGKDQRARNMSWAGSSGGIIATLGDLAQWWRALFGGHVLPQAQLTEMKTLISRNDIRPVNQIPSGLPLPGNTSAENPSGFGLGIEQFYRVSFGGYVWYYQGVTSGYRTLVFYWPQHNLVITEVANSKYFKNYNFGLTIASQTYAALLNAGIINDSNFGITMPSQTYAALLNAGIINDSGAATASR